jgi:hypothetical protein
VLLRPLMNVEACGNQKWHESICVRVHGIVVGIECLYERLRNEIGDNALSVRIYDAIVCGNDDRRWHVD